MKRVKLPLGKSSFEEIRKQGMFYIDKSSLIEEIIQEEGTDVFLFTRPRRFGKTLIMSMLSAFFDISKDSKELFKSLKISENSDLCDRWMNKCPTILVSFKSIDGLDFNGAFDCLREVIFNLYCDYSFLLSSERVDDVYKERFNRIYNGKSALVDIKSSLSLLMKMLYSHYGKKIILLIDEYDVPMAKASEKGYYDEMIDTMKGVLQVLKDNSYLQFAVVTGCLRVAKESIFTGLNNVYSNTITSTSYDEYFGFTEKEVATAFKELEIEDKLDLVKAWYDGYHFGDEDIYCPWDVIYYLRDLQKDSNAKPQNYWINTSDNQIIKSFISQGSKSMLEDIDTLLSGGYIIKNIDESITYNYLSFTEDNIWSILLMTGYVTTARENELGFSLSADEVALRIPDKEVMSIFSSNLTNWIRTKAKNEDLTVLDEALWKGNDETIGRETTKVLNKTISFDDLWHEYVYHLFFAGIFRGMGYRVESNKEHGMGKPDIAIFDNKRNRVAIFEIKGEHETVEKALNQIEEKKYIDDFFDYRLILSYGVRFKDKTAQVKLKEIIER